MRTLALVLLKTLVNLWYLKGTLERLEAFASLAELAWISKEQKQSWNLLKSRSFDMHINATVLMIVMLGCSEVDTEVSNTDMESMESNDCREMSKDNGDANNVLAAT